MTNQQINESTNRSPLHLLTRSSLQLVTAALLGALIATAGGASFGWDGLWMFALLAHIPLGLRLLLAAPIFLAPFIPAINPSTNQPINHPFTRSPLPPFTFPLAALLFWLFRERTLHGDGPGKLYLHATASLQTDPYVWKEPLDSLLAYALSGLFKGWGLAPEDAIALWSVLAGVIFVAAAGSIAGALGRDRWESWVYLTALLASGSSLLWFGHVENYSLVTAASVASTALALAYLRGRVPLWSVGVTAGAAAAFHPQAAFGFAGLLALMDWSDLRRGKWGRWLRQGVILAASGAMVPALTAAILLGLGTPLPGGGAAGGAEVGAVTGVPGGEMQLFWMPWEALAPQRLWDAVVNLWLTAPLLPWLAVGIGLALVTPRLRRDRTFAYFTLAGLGMLAYHFSFQNELARPRDWDLFAIVGPYVTLWGLWGWGMHNGQCTMHNAQAVPNPQSPIPNPQSRLPTPHSRIWLTFAVVFTVAWIGVNHAFAFVDPDPDHPAWFERVRVVDVAESAPNASQLVPMPDAEEGDRFAALVTPADAPLTVQVDLPPGPLFLWVRPQAVEDAAARFELTVIPTQGDPLVWQGPGGGDVRLALDAFQGQTVAISFRTTGGDGQWETPWILAGTPHRY